MKWRKQGEDQWHPEHVSLEGDQGELSLLTYQGSNKYACSVCHVSLNGKVYVLYGPVPRVPAMDQRYCVEHSPVAVEVEE